MGTVLDQRRTAQDVMQKSWRAPRRKRSRRGPAAVPRTTPKLLRMGQGQTVHIDILLWPGFDMHDLSALLDVFHLANNTIRESLFSWDVVGIGTDSVDSSCGLPVRTDRVFDPDDTSTNLLLLAGLDMGAKFDTCDVASWLFRQVDNNARVGLVGGASSLLAAAGLLDGRRCAAHWAHIEDYRQRHNRVDFRDQIYHEDRGILSCSGGCGTTDLALACVRDICGPEITLDIADQLNRYLVRDEHDVQRPMVLSVNSLTRGAVQLMRQHIEKPLNSRELAARLGTSLRRLQRCFRREEKLTPTQFYVRERLLQARRLLWQEPSLSIAAVAQRCGFISASDFARNFTRQFGYPPSRSF